MEHEPWKTSAKEGKFFTLDAIWGIRWFPALDLGSRTPFIYRYIYIYKYKYIYIYIGTPHDNLPTLHKSSHRWTIDGPFTFTDNATVWKSTIMTCQQHVSRDRARGREARWPCEELVGPSARFRPPCPSVRSSVSFRFVSNRSVPPSPSALPFTQFVFFRPSVSVRPSVSLRPYVRPSQSILPQKKRMSEIV